MPGDLASGFHRVLEAHCTCAGYRENRDRVIASVGREDESSVGMHLNLSPCVVDRAGHGRYSGSVGLETCTVITKSLHSTVRFIQEKSPLAVRMGIDMSRTARAHTVGGLAGVHWPVALKAYWAT